MKVVCIDTDVAGLTLGRYYDVISEDIQRSPSGFAEVFKHHSKFLLKNDLGEDKWYDHNPFGILKILPITDTLVEFLGESTTGLTKGKYYHLLDRNGYFSEDDETYYFMNDFNRFVGVGRINYFGGDILFKNTSKIRNKRLNELGI